MSGRKASEVSSLLNKGEEARALWTSSWQQTLNRYSQEIQSDEQSIKNLVSKGGALKYFFETDTHKEFPNEVSKFEDEFNNEKSTLVTKKYNYNQQCCKIACKYSATACQHTFSDFFLNIILIATSHIGIGCKTVFHLT